MNITDKVENYVDRHGLCPFCLGSGGQAYLQDVINCQFCGGEGIIFRNNVPDVFDFMKRYFRKYKHFMTRRQMTKELGIAHTTFYQATKDLNVYKSNQ